MVDIEIKYGKGVNDVVKEAISPSKLLKPSRSIPPELFTRFMSLLLKMSLMSSQTQKHISTFTKREGVIGQRA
jgi:hypothetical protein